MADKVEVSFRLSPDDGDPSPGWCCSYSPCGGYLAIGQANGRVAIWDCLTRGVARTIDISAAAAISQPPTTTTKGSNQATTSSNKKLLRRTVSSAAAGRKRPRAAPEYLAAPVTIVAWSCDSKTLLCGSASMSWVRDILFWLPSNIYISQSYIYYTVSWYTLFFYFFLGNTGATQAHVRELSFGEVMRWSLLPSTTELRQMYERQRVVFGECSENDCF